MSDIKQGEPSSGTGPEAEAETALDDADFGNSLFPAFANRVFVRTGPNYCRITFGEILDDTTYWRSAVVMTRDDLLEVGELILNLLRGEQALKEREEGRQARHASDDNAKRS